MLMRIAEYIDTCAEREELREWFRSSRGEVLERLSQEDGRVATVKEKRVSGIVKR